MLSKPIACTLTVMLAFTAFTGASFAIPDSQAQASIVKTVESTLTAKEKAAQELVFKNLNEARVSRGFDPLVFSPELSVVSQNWSVEISKMQKLQHNPNYSTQIPAGWSKAGENIASGYSPATVVETGWMNSEGHRANILNSYNEVGVGVYYDSKGVPWYTTVFANYPQFTFSPVTQKNVSNVTETSARISWSNPVINGKLVSSLVEVLDSKGNIVKSAKNDTPAVTSFDVTGLQANTQYTYRITVVGTSTNGLKSKTTTSEDWTFNTLAKVTPPVVTPPVVTPPVVTPPVVTPPVVTPPVVTPPVVTPPVVTPPVASKASIKSAGDIVAVDAAGNLWNYGNGATMKNGKVLIGSGWQNFLSTHVVDWNNDGVQDIIGQVKTTGKLYLYAGQKNGGFVKSEISSSGWHTMQIIVGQWKKTDKYPSIIAKDATGKLWVYGRASESKFSPRVQIGTGWGPFNIMPADLNQDGALDIIAKNNTSGALVWYKTDGNGKFVGTKQLSTGWKTFKAVGGAEFDGAKTSGVIASDAAGKLWYYPITKDGTHGTKRVIGTVGWAPMKPSNGSR